MSNSSLPSAPTKKVIQMYHDTAGLENLCQMMTEQIKPKADVFNFKYSLFMRGDEMPKEKNTNESDLIIWYEHLMEHPIAGEHPNQWLLVDPDFFDMIDDRHSDRLTGMIHRSMHAYNLFKDKYTKIKHIYIGGSAANIYKDYIQKDYTKIYAQIGATWRRQTGLLHELITSNADFPQLTVTQYDRAGNISFPFPLSYRHPKGKHTHSFCVGFAEEDAKIKMMNEHGVHICLGEAEAWGLYIHEAKSTKAICIVMDSPPMNEFITKETGLLVKVAKTVSPQQVKQQGVVNLVRASKNTFYDAFDTLETMSLKEKEDMGERARESYLESMKNHTKLISVWLEEQLK